jgi:hypothetical protein
MEATAAQQRNSVTAVTRRADNLISMPVRNRGYLLNNPYYPKNPLSLDILMFRGPQRQGVTKKTPIAAKIDNNEGMSLAGCGNQVFRCSAEPHLST